MNAADTMGRRIRGLPHVRQGRRPTLTPEQIAAKALHLQLNDEFWAEVSAFGVAFARGDCKAGRILTYLEALEILDARRKFDNRLKREESAT